MKKYFLLSLVLAFCFFGCQSVPKDIPQDLSVLELTQLAQTSFDNGNLKASKVYYQTILERYSDDPVATCGAEFELAHLEVKNKNWKVAKEMLNAIVAKYEADTTSSLPREYLVLTLNDLKKIPE